VSSTRNVTMPIPSHTFVWHEPAGCTLVFVPIATSAVPQQPVASHAACTHSFVGAGQSAAAEHAVVAHMPPDPPCPVDAAPPPAPPCPLDAAWLLDPPPPPTPPARSVPGPPLQPAASTDTTRRAVAKGVLEASRVSMLEPLFQDDGGDTTRPSGARYGRQVLSRTLTLPVPVSNAWFAKARSGLPSPFRSAATTWMELMPEVYSSWAVKDPSPLPSSTLIES